MEILFELLLIILEFVFELGINLFFESAIEVSGHQVKKARDRRRARDNDDGQVLSDESAGQFWAFILYSSLGFALGGLSLIAFPKSFIKNEGSRLAYLMVAPVAAGFIMKAIGSSREKKGQKKIKIDDFFYGFIFALSFTVMRYFLAQ
ncbi:MAG: hypothetical protein AB1403_10110 [Candidatus Riflebacteria bacterium]